MTQTTEHLYALIMAGGGGTRLWPLSREAHPKQMLPLVEQNQSMFQMTVERLYPLLAPDHIYVISGSTHAPAFMEDSPAIPAENFIVEPFGLNSGPAAALGTLMITNRDPDAVIAVLSADHYISQQERFRQVLEGAAELATQNEIVTLGISPSRPATEFGYIKRGELLGTFNGFDCFRADNFTEKPDEEQAKSFLQTGLFSWNSGMFIWSGAYVMQEYQRQQPAIYEAMQAIKPLIGQENFTERIRPIWEQLSSISLDYAIMEDAPAIAVIPVDIGWSDIGSWDLLYEVLATDQNGNVTRGQGPEHIQLDTTNTMVIGDRLIVTIGVDNLIVVDTDNAVLICERSHAQSVREVVRQLRERNEQSYL